MICLRESLPENKNGRNKAGGGTVIHLFWATKRGFFQWLLNRIFATFIYSRCVTFQEGLSRRNPTQ